MNELLRVLVLLVCAAPARADVAVEPGLEGASLLGGGLVVGFGVLLSYCAYRALMGKKPSARQ